MGGICFGFFSYSAPLFFVLWFISFLVSWQVALASAVDFFPPFPFGFCCRVERKNQSSFKIQFNALRA